MQLFYFTFYELKKPKHRGDQYHRSQELEPGFDFKQSDSRCFGARKCTTQSPNKIIAANSREFTAPFPKADYGLTL